LRKFETAKKLIPAPVRRDAKSKTKYGVLYFGSTTPSMHEALEAFDAQGIHLNALRVRGFPFSDEVVNFVLEHEQVFLVEQNRDGQLRTLLMAETNLDPARLVQVLHYDGTPITARFIIEKISGLLKARNVAPLREVAR
jgi:2-oxoglutarate ferredoxin oxidoreductase subunit alpha